VCPRGLSGCNASLGPVQSSPIVDCFSADSEIAEFYLNIIERVIHTTIERRMGRYMADGRAAAVAWHVDMADPCRRMAPRGAYQLSSWN
jgi:hypothetical protein